MSGRSSTFSGKSEGPSDVDVPAVAYVRMSTDHQKYSTENQLDVIRSYAVARGLQILRVFEDSGRSGLRLDGRQALQNLMAEVQSGQADFKAILVYDVSRWGRFQDADEGAYHEHVCSRAGIRVHYCGEQFENDGSIGSNLLKTVKRVMAGEYSRELSVKVFAGQCRLVELGYGMELAEELGMVLRQVAYDPGVPEQLAYVALDHGQVQMVLAVCVLDGSDPFLQAGQFLFHPRHRLGRDSLDLLWLGGLDQLCLRRSREDRIHIGDGIIVGVDQQFGRLDLAHSLHLAQRVEHCAGRGLVLQDRDGFLTYAVQEADLTPDAAHVEIERERDLLLRHAALNRLSDHLVFLNRRETADLPVVGEGFIVGGDQAFHLARACVLQRLDAHVTVEQQPGGRLVRVPDDDGRLDDPDLGDGGNDLSVLPAGFRGLTEGHL